ncbi:Matrixin [Pseudomonas asplenii]|uniref:Matrixin n=1 Tax=Pseudomonas asplenii TaxID=53407 RepID=A0A1H1XGR4_9PSED|nr:matrixin family metalloprotease [Pseudomonas asplenii]SDT07969.1 Matrixin [Pseudomonas asplenii]
MSEKTIGEIFWGKFTATPNVLDAVGLGLGVVGGVVAQGAKLGAEIKVGEEAATQVDNSFAIKGAIPSVAYGALNDGATGLFRDVAAAAGGYSAGEVAGAGTAVVLGVLGAPELITGAVVVFASVGAAFVTARAISAGVDTFNEWQTEAERSAQPITNTTVDGSFVTNNPDGSWSLSTSGATYSYDSDNNPVRVVDKVTGDVVSYDSATGTASGYSPSTGFSLSAQLSVDDNGQVVAVDPTTGGSLGSWSVNSLGDLQVALNGTQLSIPANGGLSAASVTSLNSDGSSNVTTFAGDGSATTVLLDATGNVVSTVVNTPNSANDGSSTTVFRDAQGALIGYETLSAASSDSGSVTTLMSQYGQDGLFLGTTSSEINADGSSVVSSKNAIGELTDSEVIESDGSTLKTIYNSLSDSNLTDTISANADGTVYQTASTVAGDTPDTYVTTTLDGSGVLLEKETQSSDSSGSSDYRAYYQGGVLSSTSYIGSDGSRTDTHYEDPDDLKIIQSSSMDRNGDLVSLSSTQKNESDGSYLTTTTDPSGQTLSTLLDRTDGSTTQTVYSDPNDKNIKTVIENDEQGDLVSTSTTTVGTDSDYLTVRKKGDGETTGTDKTTITYDEQGEKHQEVESYDANGLPTGNINEVTSSDGHVSADINGSGTVSDFNNASVNVEAGSTATVGGSYNNITADANATINLSKDSDWDVLTMMKDGNVILTSSDDDDVLTLDGTGTVTIADGDAGEAISASGSTFSLGQNVTASISGDTNNLVGANDTLTLLGAGDSISGAGNTLSANNESLSISNEPGDLADVLNGDGNTVTASNSAFTFDGANNLALGDGNTVGLGDDSSAVVTGLNNTVNVGSDSNVISDGGSGNVIFSGPGDTVLIGDSETNDVVVAANSLITLDGSGERVVSRGGDTINLVGANENVSGPSDTVNLDPDTSETVSEFQGVINLGTGSSLNATFGGENTVNAAGDNTIVLGSSEGGDTISASNDQITINGSGNTVIGSGNTLAVNGDLVSVDGDSNSVEMGWGSSASLNGTQNAVDLGENSRLTDSGVGGNSIIANGDDNVEVTLNDDNLSATDSSLQLSGSNSSVSGDGNTFSIDGSGYTVAGSDDVLNINYVTVTASLANGTINLGSWGGVVSDNGHDNNINSQFGDQVVTGAGEVGDKITANGSYLILGGEGESVSGSVNDITLGGIGQSVSGSYDTVGLNSGVSAMVSGGYENISLASGSSLSDGGYYNVINAAANDVLVLSASRDTVNAMGSAINLIGNYAEIYGDDNTVVVSGLSEDLEGSNNSLDLGAGSNSVMGGSQNTASLSSGSFLFANGDGGNIINIDGAGTLLDGGGYSGSNNENGDIVNISGVGSIVTLNGSGASVFGDNGEIIAAGYNESVSGDNDSLTVYGSAVAEATNSTMSVERGGSLVSDGGGYNTIAVQYFVADPTMISTLVVGDSENNDNITAIAGAVTLDGNDEAVTGGDNILNIAGTGETVIGDNDTVSLATGSSAKLSELFSQINLASGASLSLEDIEGTGGKGYNTINAGNNDTIIIGSGESNDTLIGSGAQITLSGSNTSLTIDGNDDSIAATGTNDRVIDNRTDGTSVLYDWDGSGDETDTVYSGADGSGDVIGGYGYEGTGPGDDLPGSYGGGDDGGGGDGGGYGFAGTQSLVSSRVGSSIGSIAQYDLNHGNFSAAQSAEAAQQQAASIAALTPTAGSGSAVLEGAKWDQQVITWSLADSSGTQAAPFSSYMGAAEASAVQSAFSAWANAMPGVTFEEVSDSSKSDIRIGFGDFDTANTGVVGYTSYQANAGQMEANAIIRVEDTTQDVLTTGADGQQTYAGTDATLSQVLQHEIGHALGFADNADQNSVMNYQLTASNRTLDQTDLVGIGSLYGAGASTAPVGGSGVSQLIQAMSTFSADGGVADTTLLPPSLADQKVTLSASSHAA